MVNDRWSGNHSDNSISAFCGSLGHHGDDVKGESYTHYFNLTWRRRRRRTSVDLVGVASAWSLKTKILGFGGVYSDEVRNQPSHMNPGCIQVILFHSPIHQKVYSWVLETSTDTINWTQNLLHGRRWWCRRGEDSLVQRSLQFLEARCDTRDQLAIYLLPPPCPSLTAPNTFYTHSSQFYCHINI